jgi:hypothetical protein
MSIAKKPRDREGFYRFLPYFRCCKIIRIVSIRFKVFINYFERLLINKFRKRLYPLLRFAAITVGWNFISPPKRIVISLHYSVFKPFQSEHVIFTFLCVKINTLLLSETECSKRSAVIFGSQRKTIWLQTFSSCPMYSTTGTVFKNEVMKMKHGCPVYHCQFITI